MAQAHRGEESYKQRYLPGQGWMKVVPTRTWRVALRALPKAAAPAGGEVVLAAAMRTDTSADEVAFEVGVRPGDSAEAVERKIWSLRRVGDADVAIQLEGPGGDPLEAGSDVLESVGGVFVVTLEFLRWSCHDVGVLSTCTIGGDMAEVSAEIGASGQEVAAKIHQEMGLDGGTTVKLLRLDGMPLATDESVLMSLTNGTSG